MRHHHGKVCLNNEEKGQIGGSNVVWNAEDDGNAGSTAQPACGFRGNPAVCYRPRRSRVHLGMSDKEVLGGIALFCYWYRAPLFRCRIIGAALVVYLDVGAVDQGHSFVEPEQTYSKSEVVVVLCIQPFSQLSRDVAGTIIAKQARFMDNPSLVAT
jgi:hypothetical protein